MFEQEVMTYESNIAYTLRFMIDTKVTHNASVRSSAEMRQVVGMNWVELPKGKYHMVSSSERKSMCQIEVSCK